MDLQVFQTREAFVTGRAVVRRLIGMCADVVCVHVSVRLCLYVCVCVFKCVFVCVCVLSKCSWHAHLSHSVLNLTLRRQHWGTIKVCPLSAAYKYKLNIPHLSWKIMANVCYLTDYTSRN